MFDQNTETILQELEKLQQEGIYPNIDRESAQYIYDAIIERRPKYIIEVGSANGYSTLWLGLAAKVVGGRVVTFEKTPERFTALKNNISRAGLDDFIEARLGDAMIGLQELSPVIDFVFIDAQKSQYLDYFKILEPKLVANAVIIADNIISHESKLQNFIDYVKMSDAYESELSQLGKGMLIIRKS